MPLVLVIGAGALVWYAWSHKDVPFGNPDELIAELTEVLGRPPTADEVDYFR
jgi:hypothetical protein